MGGSSCILSIQNPSRHTLPLSSLYLFKTTTSSSSSSTCYRIRRVASAELPEAAGSQQSSGESKKSKGFGSSSSSTTSSESKKNRKGKERAAIIRRSPIERPSLLKETTTTTTTNAQQQQEQEQQGSYESAFVLTWLGLGIVIILQGIALAASGFLPEEWDALFVKYLYPSFTPTVFLFVCGTVVYGVVKYLQGEKMNS